MTEPVLETTSLAVRYGDRQVLAGVDMAVQPGEIRVVLGNSGCGKSTLLKAVLGLIPVSAGRVSLFGVDSTDLPPEEREPLLRRVGVMFQYGALLNSLTVSDNVALPLQMHAHLSDDLLREVVQTRLELVGLGDAGSRLPEELSGGMRKRAALARAMALDPEILFCDEPGAGLDPVTAAGIDALLMTLSQSLGTALVVVTHELLSIERLDGRLLMLEGGKPVFDGSVAEAHQADEPAVRRFFHPGDPAEG